MNLGLAIFLSAIFLGLIWLYSLTKDKINFHFIKRIKLKYIFIFILFIILSITAYYYYPSIINKFIKKKEVKSYNNLDYNKFLKKREVESYNNLDYDKPVKETEVKGLVLRESEKDVIFVKGIPSTRNELGYYYGSRENGLSNHQKHSVEEYDNYLSKEQLFIFVKNKQVIGLCNLKDDYRLIEINGQNDLFKAYGKPDTTLITDNDIFRCYFYKIYNQIIILKQNFIRARIIYNPENEDFFLSHIMENNFLKYL